MAKAKNQYKRPPPPTHKHHSPPSVIEFTHATTEDTVMDRLEAYERTHEVTHRPTRRDEEQQLIAALALRCYHLPKHSWCEDWIQYFQNNHPLFGILCHYKLHPVKIGMRLLFLFGSIVFGLTITNVMWLWFYYQGANQDEPILTISVNGFEDSKNSTGFDEKDLTESGNNVSEPIQVTQGMLVLWTLGGGLHALFDNTIWYFSVCVCCLSSKQLPKFQCCASYCIVFLVLSLATIATFAVLLRTTIENTIPIDDALEGTIQNTNSAIVSAADVNDQVQRIRIFEASSYEFLLSYVSEFVLASFVYYPIVGTILFSGYLGCGNIPILGGRPYEVKLEQRQQQKHRNQVL